MSAQPVQQTSPGRIAPLAHARSRPHLRAIPIPPIEPDPLTPAGYHALTTSPGPEADYCQVPFAMALGATQRDTFFEPQPTPSTDLPDPKVWTARALRVVLEVMDGSRPARQLNRWVTRGIHDRAARRGLLARQRGGQGHRVNLVRSVHVCTPTDGVAEAAALVVHNGRHRAVALRLQGVDGRWLMTAFEMG